MTATIIWTTQFNTYPSQSMTFLTVNGTNYGLFLSWRMGQSGWSAFTIPNARCEKDLFGGDGTKWSEDLFAQAGLVFREDQIVEAQASLLRLLIVRLGVKRADIQPINNSRKRLTQAQLMQIAQIQPARR